MLGEIADAIRKVLHNSTVPLKLVTIATRAGRDLTSHFRKVAYRMAAQGELTPCAGCRYRLTTQQAQTGPG